MQILVADDDPVARHLLSSLLSKWGYEVTCAVNGTAAWEVLEKEDSPRLAILDWMMPGISGVDIVRRLRAQSSTPYTYVLVLTARTGKSEVLEALHAGCDDYLSKPFDAAELQARLLVGKRIMDLHIRLTEALRASQHEATHDALTGILNRPAIFDVLRQEMNRARRTRAGLSLALVDIDHFKAINDTYGHIVGDEVLRSIAQRLRAFLRSYDQVGRFGGEEFLIITPGTDATEAFVACERICRAVAESPVEVDGLRMPVTVSMGVAGFDGTQEVRAFVQTADEAMYRAKLRGRNRVEMGSAGESAGATLQADGTTAGCVF